MEAAFNISIYMEHCLIVCETQQYSKPSLNFSCLCVCLSGSDGTASSVHVETWENDQTNDPFSQISCLQQLSTVDDSEENIKLHIR